MIIIENDNRILVKTEERVIINDGSIIEYTGIYYKSIDEFIETNFIGLIECSRCKEDLVIGIYVRPLYIYDKTDYKWKEIINYKSPVTKYFLYPHLILLPEYYYHYNPLYTLDTVKNTNLNKFNHITETFAI